MKFDKRTLAALALVFIIFYFYPRYQEWVNPHVAIETEDTSQVTSTESKEDTPSSLNVKNEITSEVVSSSDATQLVTATEKAETLTVETDLYRMLVSTRGMTILSLRFKNYLDIHNEWVEIIPADAQVTLDIEFVSSVQRTDYQYADKVYKLNKNNILLNDTENKESFSATLIDNGITITKQFTVYNDKYYFDMKVLLDAPSALDVKEYAVTWKPGLAATEKNVKRELAAFNTRYKKQGEKINKKKFNGKTEIDRGSIEYIATKTKYFALAIIPTSLLGSGKECGVEIKETEIKDSLKTVALTLKVPYEQGSQDEFRIYLGPQDHTMLTDVGIGLEKIMDMGWPGISNIAIYMLKFIVWLHTLIPNYGFVIIIFSFIIKIIFYPLTHKSTMAMRNMQKIQPKLADLKKKYKDDAQRINTETMKLYKEEGVNPLGGCLPMLLQMPVFFALFRVFDTTIELRGASFMLWLTDLSQSDPTFVLPVVMGITMFFQQKLTATGAQTDQQKMMMYLMPVMMVFFFFRLSSGLVLYYSVFNILSIGQQLIMNAKEKKEALVKA